MAALFYQNHIFIKALCYKKRYLSYGIHFGINQAIGYKNYLSKIEPQISILD